MFLKSAGKNPHTSFQLASASVQQWAKVRLGFSQIFILFLKHTQSLLLFQIDGCFKLINSGPL